MPATAGALGHGGPSASPTRSRATACVRIDKMNGFGASDTSAAGDEIAAPDLRRGGFRGPRRYC